ncbi:SMF2 [[Candida] subhashii]|uniref:SMF2 n=1 Tax=[Candida] subhashii TaxID=561895 RepID=A0A8J5UGK9_9ASCO|nr:SMF2 [[Candida] subhashii]KAG7662538.1 SMF2 [[Candida] subhashii]
MTQTTIISNIRNTLSMKNLISTLKKYSRFIGPGLMVSVAYMDPGNYSTAVAAGSAYKYKLLFSIFLSNCLAIFLQILAAKLGAITGLDLASNCKEHFSFNVNIILYILTEIAIIATDLAEVVGTAIALNILFNIPLLVGVMITVIDVLVVLMAYRPKGPLLFIRIFESFVSLLVAATVVCFAIELYQVGNDSNINFSLGEVFAGFLPSPEVVDMSDRKGGNGLFLSLAILGATVMPHSLYLGSGLVQARLKDFDIKNGHYYNKTKQPKQQQPVEEEDITTTASSSSMEFNNITPIATPVNESNFPFIANPLQDQYEKDDDATLDPEDEDDNYRPSIHAIDDTMTYTMVELVISLFTVALFVNSAILIVAGATLNNSNHTKRDNDHESDSDSDNENSSGGDNYENADLFTIYNLLTKHLSPTAGFVFALALLCSGQSAGVVCTLAGQMVSEGFLNWTFNPVVRRLITRALAIMPCVFVVSIAGREGLGQILNGSQVVLSLLLPFVTAPLIYFTCNKKIMRVPIYIRDGDEEIDQQSQDVDHQQQEHIPVNPFDDDEITLSMKIANKPTAKPFQSSQSAIKLQDLRNSHPCAGWDDDEESSSEQQQPEEQPLIITSPNNIPIPPASIQYSQPIMTRIQSRVENDSDGFPLEEYQGEEGGDIYRIKGYKDFSNGVWTSVFAILIWGFITCLNLYLIGSMALGYDVPL